jgi:type IV secretion system protein VirD4
VLSTRILLGRLSRSALFAGADTSIHKSRFAHPHEVASLMHGRQPKPGTHLLIGIGPYNQVLAVTPVPTRRELGNIIVIAPPRHGKGLHATAQLLTWEHLVIVNDIKGEHFDRTGNARSRLGPVFVFDPRGYGNRYDPLKHCTTEDDFLALADQLLGKTGDKEADAFVQRARGMLTALFMAGHLEGYPLLVYLAHLIHIGPEAAAKRLELLSQTVHRPEDKNLATRFLDREFENVDFSDRYLQNSWSTLKAKLLPILTDTVIRSLSGSDFTVADILLGREVDENGKKIRKPVSIYFRLPENRLKPLAPLISLFWKSLFDGMANLYDSLRGVGCKEVLALIDEGGAAPVPGLPELAATVPGRGISIWADFQDINQPRAVFGWDRAQTLLNCMETQIYYRQSGIESSEYVERRLGRKSEFAHSKSVHEQATTEGQSEQAVPLLSPQEITELSETEILCVHRNHKPFRAKRMDWRDFASLRQLGGLPPLAVPALAPAPIIAPLSKETNFRPDFVDIDTMVKGRRKRQLEREEEAD